MPRTRPADRLDTLTAAALSVFRRKGYRRTLMSDVAAEMGVSPGLLYSYVASKEALYHHVIERLVDATATPAALPIRTPAPGDTERLVTRALRQTMAVPSLKAALATDHVDDPRGELETIVREHYDGVARGRHLLALVERSALDMPEMHDRYYVGGRRPFVARLAEYLERRIASGHFQPVPDAPTAARFIVETVAWFANHRHGDKDSGMIDDAVAEETVVHMLLAALVADA